MKNSGHRVIWVLTLVPFLALTNGCASNHWRNIEDEMEREGTGLHDTSGQKIDGFQLKGEEPSKYKGWARIANQDSLTLWSEDIFYDMKPGPVYSLATVHRLDVLQPDTKKTTFYVIGLVVLALGVAAVIYYDLTP